MTDIKNSNIFERPLSPHLQIYRPQLTSVLSIFHRMTGTALVLGMVIFCVWIIAAALGPERYNQFKSLLDTWVGLILLVGFSWALFFHLGNGIRHLIWDAGEGFELRQTYASGWAVVVMSFVLTALCWGAVYYVRKHPMSFRTQQQAVVGQQTANPQTASPPNSVLPDSALSVDDAMPNDATGQVTHEQ